MSIALIVINSLIPSLGMIAGLSASFTVPIIFILMLAQIRKFRFDGIDISKVALGFILWCLYSCWWTIHPIQSLKLFLQVFSLIFIGLIIDKNIDHLKIYISKINISISIGTIIAITLFFIEYYTNGIITNNFKALFSKSHLNRFNLYNLDRGCAILSLISWLVIYITINSRKYIITIAYYALVFYLLSISESLASLVGFLLAGVAFILVRMHPGFWISFIKCSIIIGSLSMPIIAYKIEPRVLADSYSLPLSAKHRLFIWHYVSEKALEKPIFGYGFGSSRYFEINDDQYIDYNGEKWSPLPVHPHNNIMQILLETGIVGLLLFLGIIYQFFNRIENNLRNTKIKSLYAAAFVACFVNYYVIGMISFGIWQLWWVYIGAWLVLMFRWQNHELSPEIQKSN